jgi:hypothetical protein
MGLMSDQPLLQSVAVWPQVLLVQLVHSVGAKIQR